MLADSMSVSHVSNMNTKHVLEILSAWYSKSWQSIVYDFFKKYYISHDPYCDVGITVVAATVFKTSYWPYSRVQYYNSRPKLDNNAFIVGPTRLLQHLTMVATLFLEK